MLKKIVCVLLTLLVCLCTTIPAYAAGRGDRIEMPSGNYIWQGGFNEFAGEFCESREDTIALETRLREEGYILVSSDEKEISDEEYELFCRSDLKAVPYTQYADKANEYEWQMYKVYVYKPTYDLAMKQIKEGREADADIRSELYCSTVVADYSTWYQKERIGKIVNEFNDNIPSWFEETGFLLISSPISIKMTIEYMATHTLDELYVRENEPLLVRLKQGGYYVKTINDVPIKEVEEVLPFDNNIQIQDGITTEEKPYKLELEEAIIKYNISPIDVSDSPDCSWQQREDYEPKDLSKESTVLEEEQQEKPKGSMDGTLIIIIALVAVAIVAAIYTWYKRNKRN